MASRQQSSSAGSSRHCPDSMVPCKSYCDRRYGFLHRCLRSLLHHNRVQTLGPPLLLRSYYRQAGKAPPSINNLVTDVALLRTLSSQLVFGWLGEKLGRKKVYGITLILMAFCAICSGLSFGATSGYVIGTLCFFRFWLGFGIGAVFLELYPAPSFKDDHYWRMKMPETGRYTAIIQGNAKQAAADMGRVLEMEHDVESDKVSQFKAANQYTLLSHEFYRRHGYHLIGTMTTWFLLDIAFYSLNLTQKDIFPAMGLPNKAPDVSAIREVLETSRAMFVVALLGTFPGYWFTVLFIETIGRFVIQLVGFFLMSIFMLILGVKYDYLRDHNKFLFVLLYGLTVFFANFGLNSTTFVLPAELFPTRVRSTCHALSAASGKAGAMIGAFVVQTYTLDGNVKKIKAAIIALEFTNMLGFCFTFLVPETKGRYLEEISAERMVVVVAPKMKLR
ncbi:Inorganic phosphate transporter 1-11 [Hibiscus syriacus]|uniref:Inorganic phosphate transporter 1-11 n=1 Tax=Hibiscus syriacus TaxID=106335 RepID=A0A6A2ZT38_HIBSY|nr:Inorganic phosphate transporter 1-11 [Hibiscus syriacus]